MSIWVIIATVAAIGIGIWALIVARTAWQLTHPNPRHLPKNFNPDTDHSLVGMRRVALSSRTGMILTAWVLEPASLPATVILCHGVWTNHKEMVPRCTELRKLGYGVVLFDFSGHGESEGNTTTMGYREMLDLLGVVDWAAARPKFGRLAVWGNSMGGSVAVMAAALDERLEAVIADSPFGLLRENVGRAFKRITGLPPWLFVGSVVWLGQRLVGHRMDHVRPVEIAALMKSVPLMVVQSGRDSIVSAESTQKLFKAASSKDKHLWVIEHADHVEGFHLLHDEYLAKISDFLRHSLFEPVEKAITDRKPKAAPRAPTSGKPSDGPAPRQSRPNSDS